MKVAHLIDTFAFAGTERHVLHLTKRLREMGVEASIACPIGSALGGIAQADGTFSFDLNCLKPRVAKTFYRLVAALRSGQFTVLHAHNGLTALVAAAACRMAGCGSLVTTQHFIESARMKRSGLKALLANGAHHWVDHSTTRIIAISEAVRRALLSRGYAQEKVALVLNGIDDPREENLTPPSSVREMLGVAPETPLIVASARLVREKGLDVLVRAMSQVVVHLPHARCVVAGDGKARRELEHLVEAERLTGTVSLLGFRYDVLSLVAAADVFVLPSLAEPFGLVLLEAMALGIPAIATRAGGPPEILDDGKAGLLVAPNDPRELAQAILRILQESDLAQEFRRRGRQRFDEYFTARKMAAQMLAVYEQLP